MALFAGYDHIDLRVRDLGEARGLYDALLPQLGLDEVHEQTGVVEYYEMTRPSGPRRFFGIIEDRDHQPGASRIAFSASTPAEVDRLAAIAHEYGACEIEGPEIPISSEKYYAVFFADPSGNKLEICYRRPHDDAASIPVPVENEQPTELRAQ